MRVSLRLTGSQPSVPFQVNENWSITKSDFQN
jgi:hypothetical protein